MEPKNTRCTIKYDALSLSDKQNIALKLFKDTDRQKIFEPVKRFHHKNNAVRVTKDIITLDEKHMYEFYGLISCVGLVICQFEANDNTGCVQLINGLAVHVVDSSSKKTGHYCDGWTKSGKQLIRNIKNKISKWDTNKKIFGLFIISVLNNGAGNTQKDKNVMIKKSTQDIMNSLLTKFKDIEFKTHPQKGNPKYSIESLLDIVYVSR